MQRARISKKFFRYRGLLLAPCLLLFFFWFGFWSLTASKPSFPNTAHPILFYANQTGSDFKLLFCEALAQAKQSIYIEMYSLTDPQLIQLLQTKAAQGLEVTLLTDKKASPGLQKKLVNSTRLHFHQGRGLMHRKVVVIDHTTTFLGSVNFTLPSLTLHDNFAVAIHDERMAHFFEQAPEDCAHFCYTDQTLEAWKLPKQGQKAKASIIEAIEKAKHSIYVAMFTMTDPALTEALIRAKKRGVRVSLAMDYYTAGGSSKKAAQKIKTAGITLRTSLGAQLLHHKWALIDETILITGSANWTRSAFAHNLDDFIIVRNLTEVQQKQMLRLWHSIECATTE